LFFYKLRPRRFLGMSAIWTVRHRSPPIGGRIVAPYLRPLRPVLVPRPRLEKAELFVVHLIHLAEEFDHHAIGIAVIDCNIVAYYMPQRSPGERDLVLGQKIGSAFDIGPLAHFKGDMMDCGLSVAQKVHGVMIAAATQKGEEVAAPVGNAKA